VTGLALEAQIERRWSGPRAIACGLLAGSAALIVAEAAPARRAAADATLTDAFWLGAAQAAALVPGVSRSAATRAAARARGFTAAAAAELSAEAALPVLAGATALKAVRLLGRRPPPTARAALAAGALAAGASTAAALRLERAATLPAWGWAAYRTALAAVVLAREVRPRAARQWPR
jgi:undecaprenyl-diphosphatase